jgi:hypothetical protein
VSAAAQARAADLPVLVGGEGEMTAAAVREIARSDTDAVVYDALAPGTAELHRSMVFRVGNAAHPAAFPPARLKHLDSGVDN